MAKKYLSNAFSLSMLRKLLDSSDRKGPVKLLVFDLCDPDNAFLHLTDKREGEESFVSVVGHSDTAKIFSEQLRTPVEVNRVSVNLEFGDEVVVGQYVGPRLPEGTTQLPEGSSIDWTLVMVQEEDDTY